MSGQVTERDVEWLSWLGRWKGATSPQIAARWVPEVPSGLKVVERRVRVWTSLGLVTGQRVLVGVPSIHSLTREGMTLAGIEGPVRTPNVGQLRHDLAVTDCATWLWHREGAKMLTEREVRAADPAVVTKRLKGGGVKVTHPEPKWALIAAPEAGRRLVYPDLITVHEGSGLGHEVEVTPKDHRRLVALMEAYVRAKHIKAVRYYAPKGLRYRVEKAAEEANATATRYGIPETVSVTGWEWEQ